MLFGLAPALQAARPDLSGALTEGGRGGSAGARRQRFRRGLVVSQIALALVLVAAAGLLIQSFARMRGVDPGFVPEHLLTARIELSPVRYETNATDPGVLRAAGAPAGDDAGCPLGRGGEGAAHDPARAGRLVVCSRGTVLAAAQAFGMESGVLADA